MANRGGKAELPEITDAEIISLYWQGLTIDLLAKRIKSPNGHKTIGAARQYAESVIYRHIMEECKRWKS